MAWSTPFFHALRRAALISVLMALTVELKAEETANSADTALVESVKEGVLAMDRSITLGQAFDHYRLFSAKVWTAKTAENGRRTVEAAGTIPFNKVTAKDLVAGAAAANGWAPELVTKDPKTMQQIAATLANAQKSLRGAQIVFQFSLNLDDSFELKGGRINLVTADNRVLPVVLKEEETSAALKAVYEGELPMHVLAVLLMGGGGVGSPEAGATPSAQRFPAPLPPSQGGLQPSSGLR
jgi:hypothetical protein